MDTSDPQIAFDAAGVCNHCREFDDVTSKRWFPNDKGRRRLGDIIAEVKRNARAHEYECIIGLSGGLDSSYLALKAHEWGLRPLVVHVDTGWNSELAVANIESIVKHCGYDLHTHVVDWEEMRDLQLAYLRAGVPNQDVPQDHVIFASLYQYATRNRIRYVLSGGNIASEGVFPKRWQWSAMDAVNLRAIHRRFGTRPLKTFTTVSFFAYYIWYPMVKRMRVLRLLNYIPYNKQVAIGELEGTVGWRAYSSKHGESLFTRFFQHHYMPVRFGYDKRRPHLSSLILSGQMSREEALAKLQEPHYDARELEIDIAYFCKKLRITRQEFDDLMSSPLRSHADFASWEWQFRALKRIQRWIEAISGRQLKPYS